jgi:hypothetical protein
MVPTADPELSDQKVHSNMILNRLNDESSEWSSPSLGTQNRPQGIMNENERRLLDEAQDHEEEGEALFERSAGKVDYDEILRNYETCLCLRESVHGRYHGLTARSYSLMGKAYLIMGDPRAVVAYRTLYRINAILYGKCNGPINAPFRDILEVRGLSKDEIKEIRQDIATSVRYEMAGDMLRRVGTRKEAGIEYQKAARLEELCFGRENADLAFLWRKMAFLASIKRGRIRNVEFDRTADLVNSPWMKKFKDHLYLPACQAIFRGDAYYVQFQYDHAVGEYVKATSIGRTCFQIEEEQSSEYPPKPPSSKSGNTERRKKNSRRKKRTTTSGKHSHSNMESSFPLPTSEVSKTSAMRSSHHGSDASKTTKSLSLEEFISESSHTLHARKQKSTNNMMGELEKLLSEDVVGGPPGRTVEEVSPTPMSTPVSLAQFNISPASLRLRNSSPKSMVPSQKRPVYMEVPKEVETLSNPAVHRRRSSAESTALPKLPRPADIVYSKQRRPMSQRLSRALGFSTKTVRDGAKPRSMSSVRADAEFRSEPAHVVDNSTEAIRDDDKPRSMSSMLSDVTSDLGTNDLFPVVEGSTAATSYAKPKSEPSLSSSTVMTPDPLDEEKRANSMPSLLGSPSNNSPEENEEGELDKFLTKVLQDNAALLESSSSPPDRQKKRRRPMLSSPMAAASSSPNTSPGPALTTMAASSPNTPGSLKSFLEFPQSPAISLDNKSLSGLSLLSSSVATTKENSLERFLNETAKIAAALEENEPSLIDMLAHVQKIAGLLQKQTFFLKSALGESCDPIMPLLSDQYENNNNNNNTNQLHMSSISLMVGKESSSNNTIEVSKRIEALFDNCERIVAMATSRIEKQQERSIGGAFLNPALDEYRKTFALEKVFLDQLRQGFVEAGSILSSPPQVANDGDDNDDIPTPAAEDPPTARGALDMESSYFSLSSSFVHYEGDDDDDDDDHYGENDDDNEYSDTEEESRQEKLNSSDPNSQAMVFEDGSESQHHIEA